MAATLGCPASPSPPTATTPGAQPLQPSDALVVAELVLDPPVALDFIPVFKDNALQDLLFRPDPPVGRWRLQPRGGTAPRRLGAVRFSLAIVAEMQTFTPPPAGETPPPAYVAPPALPPGASPPPGATGVPVALPTPDLARLPTLEGPEASRAAPLALALAPADVGLPEALQPGQEATLVFDFARPEVVGYFRQHPRAVFMRATLGPTDALGRPLVNALGVPLELGATVRVL
ncbi:MAG: hypothetical protein VKQ33_05855 [Candidatus Sericytochromatia bacterium]|nr:hypothetical protein [Candidatus Sericytochromatia bacterium]